MSKVNTFILKKALNLNRFLLYKGSTCNILSSLSNNIAQFYRCRLKQVRLYINTIYSAKMDTLWSGNLNKVRNYLERILPIERCDFAFYFSFIIILI